MEQLVKEELKEVIVRNSKTKFYYQYSDEQGHVFYTGDNRKGIRLVDEQMNNLLEGKDCYMTFGNSFRGKFYIDWSIRDSRIQQEEQYQQSVKTAAEKKELEQHIDKVITNDDPQLKEFHKFIADYYGVAKPITIFHKSFLYGIRNKEYDILVSALGHGRGWNDASKNYFRMVTGEKLPNTKKEIVEFLNGYCNKVTA